MPRGNNQNFIPANERSREEARENGKKGGIASGQTRRKRKTQKQIINMILSRKPNPDFIPDDLKKSMSMIGVNIDDILDNEELLAIALYIQALTDINARKYLDEITGNNPQLKLKREEFALRKAELELKKAIVQKEGAAPNVDKLDKIVELMPKQHEDYA